MNLQVTATDGDKDRTQNIVYFLTGQGIDSENPANSKFDINRTSGEIYVLKVRMVYECGKYTFDFLFFIMSVVQYTKSIMRNQYTCMVILGIPIK